jgi:hypothetical protein
MEIDCPQSPSCKLAKSIRRVVFGNLFQNNGSRTVRDQQELLAFVRSRATEHAMTASIVSLTPLTPIKRQLG